MKRIILISVILFLFVSCNSTPTDSEMTITKGAAYFNPFDKDADLEGWQGISKEDLNNDTPLDGSKSSVYISGGCEIPHALYAFNKKLPQGYYTVECWGKAYRKSIGGSVILKRSNTDRVKNSYTSINFSDSIWTYKISDTLIIGNSETLEIEMNAGGFVFSAMLIDNLTVKKIK